MNNTHEPAEPAAPTGDGGLIRLRLDLSYDGTDFSGWARQPEHRTVAQVVEDGLTMVLRLDVPARLIVAGRTDAGVHAIGQVAHVDVPGPVDIDDLTRRLVGVLPHDVGVRELHVAAPGFNARFGALGRHYAYRVTDGVPNPLRRHDTVSWPRPLDVDAMQRAAQDLVGQHDFAAYCKPRPGATSIRTLEQLNVTRDDESVIVIAAHADAFCHHQVRSMVGALLAVGEGRHPATWPAELLEARERDSLLNVAPAHGLTLIAVDYPPADQLEARAALTRQRRSH